MRTNAVVLAGKPALCDNHALSVFQLTTADGSFVVNSTLDGLLLDLAHYSEFKYGRRDLAEFYGALIAQLLETHLRKIRFKGEPIVVIGTPYKRIPNAARMLAITAEHQLRSAGLPTRYSSIYQHRLAVGDYGRLSAEERDQRNGAKKRYADPDDFIGRHVVVVDDVRITGSIERSIAQLLHGIPVLSQTYINLVKLDEEVARANPQLENDLNHQSVRNLDDIIRIMRGEHGFVLITRALKYILESSLDEIENFIGQLSPNEVSNIYLGSVEEGYDEMPKYHDAFGIVAAAFASRPKHLPGKTLERNER
jgi:hypothetical protein